MVIMGDRFLTERHEVIFAGFRSDTCALQQAGWEISVERFEHRWSTRLLLRHPEANIYAVTNQVEDRALGRDYMQMAPFRYPPFVVQRIGSAQQWRITEPINVKACYAIDARPQVFDIKDFTWEELPIFAKVKVPEEKELIVDPNEVQSLMDRILQLQAPKQKELREKARIQARQVHAQIVSLAA